MHRSRFGSFWIMSVFAGTAFATQTMAQNIAVIDVAKIFEEYQLTQDLEGAFDKQQRELTAEAENRRKSLDQMRKSLAAFDPASEEFARREKELYQSEVEYQVWSSYEEKRLKSEHKNWLRRIYADTQRIIGDVARSRGVDVVLTYDRLMEDAPDSTALRQQILLQKVIYHSDRVDITGEVLTRLNNEYASRKQGGSNPQSPRTPSQQPMLEETIPTP